MSKGRTLIAKQTAWIPEHSSIGPEDLINAKPESLVEQFYYTRSSSNMAAHGWTRVGEAEITVTLPDTEELVANKIDALRKQKDNVLAEAQNKATNIERQIQTLLAITYDAKP